MWQANNYTGLSSVTITLFLYPFISSHNVRNCCKCWLVARGGDDCTRRKQQQWKTLNANHIAACRGIIRTVPYYSVFQQLVICLIGALELNGIIIKTETDRGRRGHCGHILNETSMFWGGGTKNQLCGFKTVSQFPSGNKSCHTWKPLADLEVCLFTRWLGYCVLVTWD